MMRAELREKAAAYAAVGSFLGAMATGSMLTIGMVESGVLSVWFLITGVIVGGVSVYLLDTAQDAIRGIEGESDA